MTAPCQHTPPCSLDNRPCEPCGHCNAPAGVWCAPRCLRKPERVGEPVEDVGPERWPAEYFSGMLREEQRALALFMSDKDDPEVDAMFALPELPDMPAAGSVEFDWGIPMPTPGSAQGPVESADAFFSEEDAEALRTAAERVKMYGPAGGRIG